jgi:hypothetical protein
MTRKTLLPLKKIFGFLTIRRKRNAKKGKRVDK